MTATISVLGRGYVRLVDHMGDDLSIVRAARVSYAADWRTGEEGNKDEKLLRYLLDNHHTSPFESVVFTFEVKCPIFIARQWHRHRTWSYNEISARYTELPNEFYVPRPEHIGLQSTKNKQQRELAINLSGSELQHAVDVAASMRQHNENAFALYQEFLEEGVPRELARSVLPVATYTRFFGTVNLHNLLRFIDLRLHSHAQWEAQQYAKALASLIKLVVPVTHKILDLDSRSESLA